VIDNKADEEVEAMVQAAKGCVYWPGSTDLVDAAAVVRTLERIRQRYPTIRGLINCAGVAAAQRTVHLKTHEPHDLDLFQFVMNVNVVGTFNMSRLVAAMMASNEPVDGERGVIVNVSSVAYQDGQIGQVAYAASKGAVASMTLPMTRDLAVFGIRVCTIAPGLFGTLEM
jgi:NAD(P)-dependent dehydrogenase (short-subunit alcohol dehydrogenase family)